ncbi:MAG: GEVED domain-containing protein, partial [Planctomycetaceae bacterium]
IDINQGKNHQLIRHPVDPANANNVPDGTTFNVPDANNARFYPDQDLTPILVFDPSTGESDIPIYPFNTGNPLAGDAIQENALGLLMRNAQWLVQTVGVDGFRLDAVKHFETFVLQFFDRAVYRSIQETNLDGSLRHVFSFSEVYDGDKAFQQTKIRKDIDPGDPGRVGGNRDVLDFPLFFALRDNLTNNGFTNDWRNIRNASQDVQDDGFANNGSQGIAFVNSHDEQGAFLGSVAHAFVLMRPGNAVVYFNAEEFGQDRDFPKDGRGDALGGQYGDAITTLVNIRNSHGRGDYIDRTPGGDDKEMLIFERDASSLTVLSNRVDSGFDSRTIQTNFLAGTPLVELTGNSSDSTIDPFNDFPEVVTVAGDGTVNLRVPRNMSPSGTQHNNGYLVYGAAGPQGTLSLTNVASTIAADTPNPQTNGTARLTPIDVIAADSFNVQLDTVAVNHLGSIRDQFADGDNALLKIDQGIDLNSNSGVDFVSGDSSGFEEFTTFRQPGYFETDGNGQYIQTVDTTGLSEGTHFLDVRAFRHREPNEGGAIFSSFRKVFYVDRLDPVSAVDSFDPNVEGVNENRQLQIRSTDRTANNIHVFLDLPAATSDATILGMLDSNSQASQIDRDLFTSDFTELTHGNHVATVVTFEPSGNSNVQRIPGLFTSTIFGAGLGDLDTDGDIDGADIAIFETILQGNNSQFNPAGDFDADGDHDLLDLSLFHQALLNSGANPATLAAFDTLVANTATLDFGDAPDPLNSTAGEYPTLLANDGARHILTVGPYLGASVDADPDGQPNATSTGDDTDGSDDEDGVTFPGLLMTGQTAVLGVSASGVGLLNAFLDANGDGDWADSDEHFAVDVPLVAGANSVSMPIPEVAVPGTTSVRFRYDTFGSLSATGLASNGEVEDYEVEISSLADFGDAPSPYPVTRSENGAEHAATGPTLGATRDEELDGTHSAAADADGSDEDGVVDTGADLVVGQTGYSVTVNFQNATGGAKLDALMDF